MCSRLCLTPALASHVSPQSVYEYVNEDNNNAYRAGPIRFDPVEGYNEKPISTVRNQIIGQLATLTFSTLPFARPPRLCPSSFLLLTSPIQIRRGRQQKPPKL